MTQLYSILFCCYGGASKNIQQSLPHLKSAQLLTSLDSMIEGSTIFEMWLYFLSALIFCSAILFIPGYPLIRAMGFSRLCSLACAPVVSVGLVSGICTILPMLNVFATPITVIVPVICLSLLVFVASLALRRKSKKPLSDKEWHTAALSDNFESLSAFVLFALASSAIAAMFLLKNLDGPSSFYQGYDNATHLTRIAAFVHSGNYSSFGCNYHWNVSGQGPFISYGSFYPSAWHAFAALISAAFSASAPFAENALNYVTTALVFPLGSLALLSSLLNDADKKHVIAACAIPLAFAVFPWLLLKNVFPNALGLGILPAEAFFFIEMTHSRKRPGIIAGLGLLFLIGLLGMGLSHPNSVFTLIVLLVPYCFKKLLDFVGTLDGKGSRVWKVLLPAAFVVMVCAFWYGLYSHPAFQGVVSFHWPAFDTKTEAIRDIVLVGYRSTPVQISLALLVFFGCIATLKNDHYRWLFFPFALAAVMYFFNASTDGFLKHLLTGFWYTDSYRVSAMLAIFAALVASIGAVTLCRLACEYLKKQLKRSGEKPLVFVTCVSFAVLFSLLNYYPSLPSPGRDVNAFEFVGDTIRWQNLQTRHDDLYLFTEEERAFVEKVDQVIPEGALVLNEPFDGSVYALGMYDLNVYYRTFTNYGHSANESEESILIRKELCDVSSSEELIELLEELDADYLLLLDVGYEDLSRETMISYYEDAWANINSIDDNTPGFEVVLSEGDMRLYRICP